MEATNDATGRAVVAQAPRTAKLERDGAGRLVARSDTPLTDDILFSLINAGRR